MELIPHHPTKYGDFATNFNIQLKDNEISGLFLQSVTIQPTTKRTKSVDCIG